MKANFSKKEYEMISQLSPHWKSIIDNDAVDLPVVSVLEMIALDCFVKNTTGKAADSLRRCVDANKNGDPYRNTPEYEELIQL